MCIMEQKIQSQYDQDERCPACGLQFCNCTPEEIREAIDLHPSD